MKHVTATLMTKVLHKAQPGKPGGRTRRAAQIVLSYTDAQGNTHTRPLRLVFTGTPFQAEAAAAIAALEALREPCAVTIATGCEMLAQPTDAQRRMNGDLWRQLARAGERHAVTFSLVAPARPRVPGVRALAETEQEAEAS